jgi:hypothetical protein
MLRNSLIALCVVLLPMTAMAEALMSGAARRGPTEAAVQEAFRQAVEAAFPPGTREAALAARLTNEGFGRFPPDPTGTVYAEFSRFSFPCRLIWRIIWKTEGDNVRDLDVVYGRACL